MSGLGGRLREVKTIGGVNQVSWGPALGQRQYKGQLLLSSFENINQGAGYMDWKFHTEISLYHDRNTSIPWLKSKIENIGYDISV